MMAWLKLNEIKRVIKRGGFLIKVNNELVLLKILRKVAEEVLQWNILWKFNMNAK
jgi:hypothetical protein